MADWAIEVEHLARRYGRRWALVDVSLTVARGEVLMVAGRNGSGKSTLFRILATAIRPDRGVARVAGFDVVDGRDDVRRATALLSHYSYLYESLTALQNLQVLSWFAGKGDPKALLERVGLATRAGDPVSTFSAGMRKRLSFARILLQEPEVILLDEPYGQLDPPGFALVDEVVRELRNQGKTVLMATHQLERGASLADHSVMLESGRVIWNGPAKETPACN
jgi:heme exporter protein A